MNMQLVKYNSWARQTNMIEISWFRHSRSESKVKKYQLGGAKRVSAEKVETLRTGRKSRKDDVVGVESGH